MSNRISLRRLVSVIAVGAFAGAAMLGVASSAHAVTSMSCAFVGGAGPITPGPEGIVADVTPVGDDPFDTDSGTYEFNTLGTTAACEGVSTTGPFAYDGTIHSTGSYTNTLCSTWSLNSQFDTQVTPSVGTPFSPSITSAIYDITVAAGQGPLTVHEADVDTDPQKVHGSGWVSITPNDPGPSQSDPTELPTACTLDRATGFLVEGFFELRTAP